MRTNTILKNAHFDLLKDGTSGVFVSPNAVGKGGVELMVFNQVNVVNIAVMTSHFQRGMPH